MEVVHQYRAGLDVHKKPVIAYCRSREVRGRKVTAVAIIERTTVEVMRLWELLPAGQCTHVVIESTGEF